MHTTVDRLAEGDCFLYDAQETREREGARLEKLSLLLASLDLDPIDPVGAQEHLKQYAEPHIIVATVLATGHRISQRVSDGKRFIWYEPAEVEYVDRQDEFEERLRSMAEQRAKFDKLVSEMQRKRRKSKKQVMKEAQAGVN